MEMEGAQELPQANPDGRSKVKTLPQDFSSREPTFLNHGLNVRVEESLVMGKGF